MHEDFKPEITKTQIMNVSAAEMLHAFKLSFTNIQLFSHVTHLAKKLSADCTLTCATD